MKRYALNLDTDNRILSVCDVIEGQPYNIIVEDFPKGKGVDVHDYLYINGEYVHDPEPTPEPTAQEPTVEEDTLSMLVDHEERIINLELGLTEQKGA